MTKEEYQKLIKIYYEIIALRCNSLSINQIAKKYNLHSFQVSSFIKNGQPVFIEEQQYVGLQKINPRVRSKLETYLTKVRQTTGRSRAREMVRLRDKHTCQDCGFVLKTIDVLKHNQTLKTLKGKWKSLDVHHINGMCGKNSLGYDSPKDISGMITLCHKCHFNRPEHTTKKKSFICKYNKIIKS